MSPPTVVTSIETAAGFVSHREFASSGGSSSNELISRQPSDPIPSRPATRPLGSLWKPIGISHCQASPAEISHALKLEIPQPIPTSPPLTGTTSNLSSAMSSDVSSRHAQLEPLRLCLPPASVAFQDGRRAVEMAQSTTQVAPPPIAAQNPGTSVRAIEDVELWHACAGPLVTLPAIGSVVVYFPQGHAEQQERLAETRRASYSAHEGHAQADAAMADSAGLLRASASDSNLNASAPPLQDRTRGASSGGSSGSGSGATDGNRSCHEGEADAPASSAEAPASPASAALPPSHMFCRLQSVALQIDVDTHELLATMQLQPISEAEAAREQASQQTARHANTHLYPRTEHDRVCCKRLSTSDTSTHGGFSIPRKAAEACLPQLDMSQSVPSQRVMATDILGNQWLFRHVYRGTPKRHLLTTGWSALTATWGLTAGDRIVFLRNRAGLLKVAVQRGEASMGAMLAHQRAQRTAQGASQSASLEAQTADAVLSAAARSYNQSSGLSVTFHPWLCPSAAFVVPLSDFTRGLHLSAALRPGNEVRLSLEADDLSVRRIRGTVVALNQSPNATWPSSPWRSVKIKWGDLDSSVPKPVNLSPWLLEDALSASPHSSYPSASVPCAPPLSTTFSPNGSFLSHSLPPTHGLTLPPRPAAAPHWGAPQQQAQQQQQQEQAQQPQHYQHPQQQQWESPQAARASAAAGEGEELWDAKRMRLSSSASPSLGPLTAFHHPSSPPSEPRVSEPRVSEPRVSEPRVSEPHVSEPRLSEPERAVWSRIVLFRESQGPHEAATTAAAAADSAGATAATAAATHHPSPIPRNFTAPGGLATFDGTADVDVAATSAAAMHGEAMADEESLQLSLTLRPSASPPLRPVASHKRRRVPPSLALPSLALPSLRSSCHSESDVCRLLVPERDLHGATCAAARTATATVTAAHLAAGGSSGNVASLFTLPSSPSSGSGGSPRSSSAAEENGGRAAMERSRSAEKWIVVASPSSSSPSRSALKRRIKLRVEGSPVGRTVDLSELDGFQSLYAMCTAMLKLPLQLPGQPSASSESTWQLTYTDTDGDTLLVGDGPWSVFLDHVQTLTAMKAM